MADVTLDDILADTTAEGTEVQSLATLTAGIKAQLDQALSGASLTPAQQAKVNQIFANIEANKGALATAITANTPSNPTPPTTGGAGPSSTVVTTSGSPATVGAPVAFTATVSAAGSQTGSAPVPATGTVQFLDGTANIGSGTLDATGATSLAVTTLAAGDHSITAVYGGDANYAASTSGAITQTVA